MGQPRTRYLLDDYRLEPDARLLSRGGRPVRLPKKPFQVLLYLVERRDRYVSRAELLDLFWEGREVYDDALRKCVGAIRKALDDRSDTPRFVETRWGVGYRYIGPAQEQVVREESSPVEIEKTRGVRIVVEEEEISDDAAAGEVAASDRARTPAFSLPTPKRHAKAAALALALLSVVVGAVLLLSYRPRSAATEGPGAPVRSVAVLPLKNLTGDPANEYLSDGITESLITSLSRIGGLKVISRGSSFAFKGRDVDPREAGGLLGVESVLEGSVRRDGDRVRVEVRLVSTSDGAVLWASDAYDRPAGDIFAVQDEVARNVVGGLRVTLNGEDGRRLAARYTGSPEAYEVYLKGRFFLNKRTPEGIEKGIEYFRKAVEIDPNYALAYARLVEAYDKAYWFLRLPPGEVKAKEKEAASKALALDDSLAEAHLAMATVYATDWELSKAAREQERALAINPGSADAHHGYAYSLVELGRPDEAVAEIERARELDPLNVVMHVDVGEILLYAGRYDEAVESLRQAIEMEAGRANAHYDLALAYELKGMDAEAFREYLKDEALGGAGREATDALNEAYAASGMRGFWRKKLEMERARAKRSYVAPVVMAREYARLGERDRAFDWLERAYAERAPTLADLKVDPTLDALRSDPRYSDLLRRVGLQ